VGPENHQIPPWEGTILRGKAEADLGMFSMFGRTGAPTKKGPPQEDMGRK